MNIRKRSITYIEAPSNLGLKKMPYADVLGPGVRKMPTLFRDLGLPKSIGAAECIEVAAPNYDGKKDKESGVLNLDQLVVYTKKLSQVIKEVVDTGKFPIVIGGDCSILLGSMLALKQKGRYGLAHVDGHTDFAIGNKTSTTGGAAGMDLAIATGQGSDSITNIYGQKPYTLQSDIA
ncbi:MAG TPA: arginase family protein, partial [Flavitalea sp.]|nr:arginase family protein [Flavitalea sp.]